MKRLLFIVNPKAGRTVIKNDFFEIIMIFSEAGYEVTAYPTTGPDDAERKVIADGKDYDLIVCAGGDGTLENTVSGYMKMGGKRAPLGYIPVGTTNDFARSLNISRRAQVAAKQIVSGNVERVDVGQLEDRYFIYIAAFGIFTDISYSTDQSLKKVMGHSAYVIEGIKNIVNYRTYNIRAELDGQVITGEYIYGMISNSYSVAGFKIRGAKNVVLDDGKFDCLFIKKPSNVTEFQKIVGAVLSNNFDSIETDELFFACKASSVKIECDTPVSWTLDGEFGGEYSVVNIQNHKQEVEIYLDENQELYSSVNRNEPDADLDDDDESFYDDDEYTDGWD
jgi:YegS/Rv2252/BmrU family lipid kinase